jgi:hypothetical protein
MNKCLNLENQITMKYEKDLQISDFMYQINLDFHNLYNIEAK